MGPVIEGVGVDSIDGSVRARLFIAPAFRKADTRARGGNEAEESSFTTAMPLLLLPRRRAQEERAEN